MAESIAAREKDDAEGEANDDRLAVAAASSSAAAASSSAAAAGDGIAPFDESKEEVGSPDFYTDALKLVATSSGNRIHVLLVFSFSRKASVLV